MSHIENKTVHLVSLGCPKNETDSEYLLGGLAQEGYLVEDDPEKAGVLLVNTCAFIQPAVEESVETILDLARYRTEGAAWALVVAGCLAERYKGDLAESLPEVDILCGTGDLTHLPLMLERLSRGEDNGRKSGQNITNIQPFIFRPPGHIPGSSEGRFLAGPTHRAYLKIGEGCDRSCTYCIIPSLRGPYRSRPLADLLKEAKALALNGVKELTLVAQDTTAYGQDLHPDLNLAALLKGLAGIKDILWLRIMYAYPSNITDDLMEVMSSEPKVCAYLDLPLQHSSRQILKRMGRGRVYDLLSLINRLKDNIPGLSLRTTFMTGFPGETEDDFVHLLNFCEEVGFDQMGAFTFFPEDGSKAANLMDQVPEEVKLERKDRLMSLQHDIVEEKLTLKIGSSIPVFLEGVHPDDDDFLYGRTEGQAPEVDGEVLIEKFEGSQAGQIVKARIIGVDDYDLLAKVDRSDLTKS